MAAASREPKTSIVGSRCRDEHPTENRAKRLARRRYGIDLLIVNLAARHSLAKRMLGYYQTTASYHADVKAIAPDRPSEEELVLFRALVKLYQAEAPPRVLELGGGRCESAPTLMELLGHGDFHAIDASPDAVAFARARFPQFKVEVGDIAHIPHDDNSFDIVFMNYVLEHTCEPNLVLDEAIRVARPGGLIGMIVPVGDLPWIMPQSLRHHSNEPAYLIGYAAQRWIHLLRVRYSRDYFEFPLVTEPFVLVQPGQPFLPDDDQVYQSSSLEILKYLRHRDCDIDFSFGRDISTYIRNGRRPVVDWLRTLAFLGLRGSLWQWAPSAYTSCVTIVARKR